eukprot:3608296-Ditylum_brightwellii.AAC.1
MIVMIVVKICEYHNIQEESITVACNGREALRKVFLVENNFSCKSSQYDIISAIDHYIKDSNITWKLLHVKGHQDDFYDPLDYWSTLNVETDELAKKC